MRRMGIWFMAHAFTFFAAIVLCGFGILRGFCIFLVLVDMAIAYYSV
jgi:hypothetical protein